MNDNVTVINIVASVTDETASGAQSAIRNVSKLEQSVMKLRNRLDKMKGKNKLEVQAELRDMATKGIQSIASAGRKLAGKVWTVTLKAKDFVTAPFRKVLGLLANPIAQAAAFAGVSVGVADTINTFKSFEAAMSQVKAISGASAEGFAQLTAKAEEMGAKTKFTATEAAEAFNYMAMAGWKTNDMLGGIEGILSLAAASGEDLATTSDIVTDAMTAFGMQASEAGHFADVLAVAASSANTNVGMMGETFKYVGSIAGAFGYSIEDSAIAIGLMANTGVKASQAGTALSTIITRLSTDAGASSKSLGALGTLTQKLGVQFYKSDGGARALNDVLIDARAAWQGLTMAQQANYAKVIAGQEATKGWLALMNAAPSDIEKITTAVEDCNGAAKAMSDVMMDNLQGSMQLLQSAADGVKISLGKKVSPYIRSFVDWLTARMPDVENAVGKAVDSIAEKLDSAGRSIKELTSSSGWKNAESVWEKAGLAWDALIAEPFDEWWSGTGKAWLAEKAQGIGSGIGTALKTGILALLGVDVSGAAGDGKSIGRSFAEGFMDGFDAKTIAKGLMEALKVVAKDAGGLFTGEGNSTSGLSAALLGYGALRIGKVGHGVYQAGNALLGSAAATAASTTAGIGGTVAAGASLISAVKDVSTAIKTDNLGERGANVHSAMVKGSGVAAGAAIGAGIGTLIPIPGVGTGVGALVGAGIGGLVGIYKGDQVKSDYYEQERVAALSGERSKYKSQELKDALADASVSADDFAKMLEKTVRTDIAKHFGKMALSASEISAVASSITDRKDAEAEGAFQNAAADKQSAYQSVRAHAGNLGKLNWEIGLGLALDEGERGAWEQELNGIYDSVRDYLTNSHYEATTAIKLLVGADSEFDLSGLDSVYSSLNEQLQGLGEQYKGKIELALKDGVITLDEQAEIQSLQDQITAITSKVAEIETTASMKALQIKYSGAALDADSFAALQSELAAQVQTATASYDDALKVGIQSLELQLSEGAINQEQYNEQLQTLADSYDAKISELQLSVESFQLKSIADAYARDLEGILPDIQGTTAEKLQTAIGNAMTSGVDVTTWSSDTAAKWLGIGSLNKETQTAIAGLVSSVAETLPKNMREGIEKSFKDAEVGDGITESLSQEILNAGMGPIQTAADTLKMNTGNALEAALKDGFDLHTTVRLTADYSITNPTPSLGMRSDSVTQNGFKTPRNAFSMQSGSAILAAGIAKNARGSIVAGPLLSLVGEDGPEAIIPLSGKHRDRGLDLWEKAGKMLGVKQYAEGDIVGYDFSAPDAGTGANTGTGISVQIDNITFEIRVDGGGKEGQTLANEIAKAIREQMPEITNEVAQRIAEALQQIYSNTPKANWRR